ncbi:unnamed protein product [Ceutorhynchus assimilis]|uniref:SWIM-type domain-containing protein n=1 Tax=Ceutorhynchus assimilis TaxID=467358 RepID=A0A9N9MZI4_9CUCU|nr:unnamed protein product [Ceutorhynchus assimilis]
MTAKHALKLSSIFAFFENDSKAIKKGENALESNHVQKMQFDAGLMIIRGQVQASMKDKEYKVEINLNNSGEIGTAKCMCPRGIKCHHIAALALFGHYNISVTDKECTWNVPKSKSAPLKTAEEFYPSKPFKAVEGNMSEEAKNKLREQLSTFGNTVGFTWLLQEDNHGRLNMNLPLIEDIVTGKDFYEAENKLEYFKIQVAIEDNVIHEITMATVGQVSNERWYLARKYRLTASNFGLIISACKRNRYPESLFKTLFGSYNLDGIKSIQWGRHHEKDGLNYLKENYQLEVKPTGIWLTCSELLGASPDGLVGDDAIVEVKCPYSFRNDVLSEKLKSDKKYIIYYNENGEMCLNTEHNYYHQIQGNLSILKRQKCYLVVWTPKEAIVVMVEYDPAWEIHIGILENFYFTQYFPKLIKD